MEPLCANIVFVKMSIDLSQVHEWGLMGCVWRAQTGWWGEMKKVVIFGTWKKKVKKKKKKV